MKIAIDGHFIAGNKTGVGYYSYYLLKELLNIDKENSYYIIFNSLRMKKPDIDFLKNKNVKILFTPFSNRFPTDIYSNITFMRYNYFFPFIFKIFNIDIFHGFNCRIPETSFNVKTITTFHDMSMITMKNYVNSFEVDQYQIKSLKRWSKKADKIISVSYNSEKDILKYMKPNKNKLITIQNGFDIEKYQLKKIDGLNEKFIVFVGSVDERKNVRTCIETFYILKEKYNLKDIKLMICGNDKTEYANKLKKEISEKGYLNNIIFTGYVDINELAWIYSNAELLFFPTFYEGFGFPALEAMKYNCPVVCSNNSSLPEIVENCALTAEPDNKERFAEHINSILNNRAIKNELIEKGKQQILKFSWKENAKKVLNLYKNIKK